MVILIFKEAGIKVDLEVKDIKDVNDEILRRFCLASSNFYLTSNGRKLNDFSLGQNEIHLVLRVAGGKGGFGSNLRSIQVNKTSNTEACRDLSGRRFRDINNEQKMKSILQKEKNEVKEDPDEVFERKIKKLLAVPKVEVKKLEVVDVHDSVEQGLKRNAEKSPEKTAKKKIKGGLTTLVQHQSPMKASDHHHVHTLEYSNFKGK